MNSANPVDHHVPTSADTASIGSAFAVDIPAQYSASVINLTVSGILTVAAQGSLAVSGTASVPGGLDVFGTASAGIFASTGAVTIESGGVGTINTSGVLAGTNTIDGQLEADGGASVTLGGTTTIGPGDLNGNLSGQPGSSFTLNGSAETFLSGATLGAGTYNVNFDAPVTLDGTLDDVAVINLNDNGGGSGPGSTSGSVSGSGSLDVKQDLNWTGGTLGPTGGTTIESSGSLSASGPDLKTLGSDLTNESMFCTLGGTGNLDIADGATLTNAVGQIDLSLPVVGVPGPFGGTGTLDNSGGNGTTLKIDGNTTIACNFTNDGILSVASGASLTLSNTGFGGMTDDLDGTLQLGGDLTLLGAVSSPTGLIVDSGSGRLLVGNGATAGALTLSGADDTVLFGNLEVTGTGTLAGGNVDNNGDLDLDVGSATSLGSYRQSSTGTLELHAAKSMMSAVNSTLTVSGTAGLSGVLKLDLDGGYVPTSGTTFTVVSAGSVTSHFDTTPAGMTAGYTPTAVTLTQN